LAAGQQSRLGPDLGSGLRGTAISTRLKMQFGEGQSYEPEATKNLQLPIEIGLKDRGFLQTRVAKTGLRACSRSSVASRPLGTRLGQATRRKGEDAENGD